VHLLCAFGVMFQGIVLTFGVPPAVVFSLQWAILGYPRIGMITQIFASSEPSEALVDGPGRVSAVFGYGVELHLMV